MSLIECKDVSIGYENSSILDHLSFQINEGDYLYVIGENGSGKSTLIKTLLGLISPIYGEIAVSEESEKIRIGYLPQQTDIQKEFPATVKEIVLSGCLNRRKAHSFYTKEDKEIAEKNMERLGVASMAKKCFSNLSGGQKQRVLLARALCAAGNILLLDEPVTGLDPIATETMYELIKNINDDGMTVIMVSHDIETIDDYASHVLYLGSNRFFWGTKEEYKERVRKNGRSI